MNGFYFGIYCKPFKVYLPGTVESKCHSVSQLAASINSGELRESVFLDVALMPCDLMSLSIVVTTDLRDCLCASASLNEILLPFERL
jgi:3-polyprenyl-4-hydroxybenzoate decarboxylase